MRQHGRKMKQAVYRVQFCCVHNLYLRINSLHASFAVACRQCCHWWPCRQWQQMRKLIQHHPMGCFLHLKRLTLWIHCERICCKIRSAHEETKIVLWNFPLAFLLPRVAQTTVDSIPAWALPSLCTFCSIGLLSTPPSAMDLNYSLWSVATLRLPWENTDGSKSNADRLVPRNADLLNDLSCHHSVIEVYHVLHLLMVYC